ncbi:hypothetical protein [Streptacidiphilus jiangxiensis]|uniref:hypothetical protein n=1 Tax=Streptacidiphilus jiangxiensis TaxID=235985 RepID=UPI001160D29E|nr:hypothetical protein [Streptacidiphilus jiangxiensis]
MLARPITALALLGVAAAVAGAGWVHSPDGADRFQTLPSSSPAVTSNAASTDGGWQPDWNDAVAA